MDILANCACETEFLELQDMADRLFEALSPCVPNAPDVLDPDPLCMLSMPKPCVGNPQPIPTQCKTACVTSLPPRARTAREEWTREDDAHILALFNAHGTKWRKIARASPRFGSDDAVRNRVQRLHQKGICGEARRSQTPRAANIYVRGQGAMWTGTRAAWTENEDQLLLALSRTTHAWSVVSTSFQRRTPHACRNRVFRLTATLS